MRISLLLILYFIVCNLRRIENALNISVDGQTRLREIHENHSFFAVYDSGINQTVTTTLINVAAYIRCRKTGNNKK
jgi:hypothetical protein